MNQLKDSVLASKLIQFNIARGAIPCRDIHSSQALRDACMNVQARKLFANAVYIAAIIYIYRDSRKH